MKEYIFKMPSNIEFIMFATGIPEYKIVIPQEIRLVKTDAGVGSKPSSVVLVFRLNEDGIYKYQRFYP